MTTRSTSDLISDDRSRLWHPYSSTIAPGPLHVVREARAARLVLDDGVEVIDAMASWWCMIHGYRRPELDEAVRAQTDRFAHVMFGGLTHEPAVELASALATIAPPGLGRVFLADSGSVAVEVALKLARQVQLARGYGERTKIAALRGGYHGDTLGAMSVCDPIGGMHAMYAGSVPEQVFLPRPPGFAATDVSDWLGEVEAILARRRDVAAVIVEPALQGAGGMWPWSPAALAGLSSLATELGLLLVADEIATGFGRTGRLWGCDHASVLPDVLVLGKALTGGYLTQAAVLTGDGLASEIGRGPAGALMHGPTFMANPLACAASLASLSILATGAWRPQVAAIEAGFGQGLAAAADLPGVVGVRVLGACGVIELERPVDMAAATATAIAHGVWLRPFGRLVYAMPPYIVSSDEVARICAAMIAVAEQAGR